MIFLLIVFERKLTEIEYNFNTSQPLHLDNILTTSLIEFHSRLQMIFRISVHDISKKEYTICSIILKQVGVANR